MCRLLVEVPKNKASLLQAPDREYATTLAAIRQVVQDPGDRSSECRGRRDDRRTARRRTLRAATFLMKWMGGLKQQVAAGVPELTVDGRTPQRQIAESSAFVRHFVADRVA